MEVLVPCRIFHHEGVRLPDGPVAERLFPGSLPVGQSLARLQPLPLVVNERDGCHGYVEQPLRQADHPVEALLAGSVQHAQRIDSVQTFLLGLALFMIQTLPLGQQLVPGHPFGLGQPVLLCLCGHYAPRS